MILAPCPLSGELSVVTGAKGRLGGWRGNQMERPGSEVGVAPALRPSLCVITWHIKAPVSFSVRIIMA